MSNANESGEDTRNAELFDPDDPEYQKQLWRPPDIDQDVKEMERRKRVEIIMNSLAEEFDNELLIALVQARPVLWNKYSEMNKSQRDTRSAWNEVCSLLVGEFESMTEATQNAIRQAVTRRWNNIRNSYAKYQKKLQNWQKSGGEGPKIKPYVYHDLLQFLSKQQDYRETSDNMESTLGLRSRETADNMGPTLGLLSRETVDNIEPTLGLLSRETSDSMEKNWEDGTSDNEELILPKITSTRSIQPIASRKRHKPMEQETSNVRHMAFFEAMMPHLNKFNDSQILEFQMGVLQVIKNINDRKNRGPPAPCYPQYRILPGSTQNNIRYLSPATGPATYSQFISSTSNPAS